MIADSETDAPPRTAIASATTQPAQPDPSDMASETDPENRDPFTVSADTAGSIELGPQFVPGEGGAAVPPIRLRGYVEVSQSPPVALIEIERHGSFVVRKGDTISLQSRASDPVLKIRDLSNLSVTVEVGSIGRVIVVR